MAVKPGSTISQTDLPLMPADERRTEMRAQINMLAAITTEDGEFAMVPVVDISTGGMRVRPTGIELTEGQNVDLEFEVDGESIEAKGRVVNLPPGFAGIKFVDIDRDHVVTLELVLSRSGWD